MRHRKAEMDLPGALDVLRYFDEKVDRLASLPFTKYVREHVMSTPNLLEGHDFSEEDAQPSAESVDAFVLTLRFFVQNNEPISIANIAALYATLPVSEETRALVTQVRDELNRALDAYSPLGIEGQRLQYREIFDTFMYGWLAHGSDQARRETAARWRSSPRRFAYLRALFMMTLMDFIEALLWLRAVNRDTLAALDPRGSG